jgi:dTDP-4-amino-4,6-dideoxygalactose transaminase
MYTTTAVLAIGADPFFMDVQLETRVVSSAEVAKALKQNVHAVVVTHLYGQIVPEIEEIQRLCAIAQVPLIEDCAQAHGASLRDKQAGSFGTVGCFSFYPTKNLGALGDGGAVVTDCEELAERVKALRQYGWTSKYRVEHHGARNSRLDELQAAVLSVFLTRLDEWNHRRRAIARQYNAALANSDIHTPNCSGLDYVGHLYVLRTQQRDALRCFLQERGISSDVHYPIPDHRQPIFGERYSDVALRVTEQLCREVLTVPCYPEMSAEEVSTVTTALQNWCKEREISHGLR